MSTTPNVVPVDPAIQAAWRLLEERIAPAKLLPSAAEGNVAYLNGYFAEHRLRLSDMRTIGEIVDSLYAAILSDSKRAPKDRKLRWAVLPKLLQLEVEQANQREKKQDTRDVSTFTDKVRAAEKKDVDDKAQAAAKKRCGELVERFAPLNHRRGTLNYDLRDTKQAEWRQQILTATDFETIEKQILAEQKKLYDAAERAAQRV